MGVVLHHAPTCGDRWQDRSPAPLQARPGRRTAGLAVRPRLAVKAFGIAVRAQPSRRGKPRWIGGTCSATLS
jgi:hypothetical protein